MPTKPCCSSLNSDALTNNPCLYSPLSPSGGWRASIWWGRISGSLLPSSASPRLNTDLLLIISCWATNLLPPSSTHTAPPTFAALNLSLQSASDLSTACCWWLYCSNTLLRSKYCTVVIFFADVLVVGRYGATLGPTVSTSRRSGWARISRSSMREISRRNTTH